MGKILQMKEDYGYYKKTKRPKRKHGIFGFVFDAIVLVVTFVVVVLLLLSCLAPYVDPNRIWPLAFLGLIFPVLYVVCIACALYWIIRWKRWFFVAAVALAVGAGNVGLFFRVELKKHYGEQKTLENEVVVMSYNVEGFSRKYSADRKILVDSIGHFAASQGVDILCIQEFMNSRTETVPQICSLVSGMKYVYLKNYDPKNYDPDANGLGLVIFSRYPIIANGTILPESSRSRMIWADVKIRRDTVRVINNHLQNTSISVDDRDFITSGRIVKDAYNDRKIKDIVKKLRTNNSLRATQADSLAAFIARSPYRVIVCGDFNDSPMSYTYRTIRGPLSDTYVEKGRGAVSTYHGIFNMFRIDYILVSEGIGTRRYRVADVEYSDHSPIVAGLMIAGNDE